MLLRPAPHGQDQLANDRVRTELPWVYCKAMVPWRVVEMTGAWLDDVQDKGFGLIEMVGCSVG
jgi:hypothetical protein